MMGPNVSDVTRVASAPVVSDPVIVGRLLEAAINDTASEVGNVQLIDSAGALHLVAHRGFDDEFLEYFRVVSDDQSACGLAVIERAPVMVGNVDESGVFVGHRSLEIMRRAGICSVVSQPIFNSTNRLVGMVSVHRSRPSHWGSLALARLFRIAQDIGEETERSIHAAEVDRSS